MQKTPNGQHLYSPSDLITFLGCRHATFLDMQRLAGKIKRPESEDHAKLLAQKGIEHERAHLARLRDQGLQVVAIPNQKNRAEQTELTAQALHSGADVIYQARLAGGDWVGYADFLIRVPAASKLGQFSYEVLDTKLARKVKPDYLLQLSAYSQMLASIQGLMPAQMHLVTGDGTQHSFPVHDSSHYHDRTRQLFEEFVADPPQHSEPEPCNHCAQCSWQPVCQQHWQEQGHLSLVANMRRSQITKLRAAGINSIAQLAALPDDRPIDDLDHNTCRKLVSQARLQQRQRSGDGNHFEPIDADSQRGLRRLPRPDGGDLFFDIEGDPLYRQGLEYLFGVFSIEDGQPKFRHWLAHDHEQECARFKELMAFLAEHLGRHPGAHIYHYNHYETSALKRLAGRYATCEEQLDNLLRAERFVDLYYITTASIRTSEPGYSLKNMETFYREKRQGEVTAATDSLVAYNRWQETGDDAILQEIVDYNRDDCESTWQLRDWLVTLRPGQLPWRQLPKHNPLEAQRKDHEIEHECYLARLATLTGPAAAVGRQLADLLEFHRREDRPQWWAFFERAYRSREELLDDAECIAGLQKIGFREEKRSIIHLFSFPHQESKLGKNSQVVDTATLENMGRIVELDWQRCQLGIKRAANREMPSAMAIGPTGPVDAKMIREAIYRYADRLLDDPERKCAATDLLARTRPRGPNRVAGQPLVGKSGSEDQMLEAVAALDHSCLFIQGPPGAGKTHYGSRLIVDLIGRGKKVGIAANSHHAIHNLLARVEQTAQDKGVSLHGFKKASSDFAESFYHSATDSITNCTRIEDINTRCDLIAGTAWAFAHPFLDDSLDYLFIDEAGQVATANVVAMANAATNVVLIGDQMQLGQPLQGLHPGEAGLSVLDFLLGERAVIEADRGIFLPQTRRLHPGICQFVSQAFYAGQLKSHPEAASRTLQLSGIDLPASGIATIHVDHAGCAQKSDAEAQMIEKCYQGLIGQQLIGADKSARPISGEDILIISPYNIQTNHLASLLPDTARVGTIDKFQGQEAPIVIISMTSSSAEDAPRGLKFLLDRQRLNVAVSRAQCLAVVVFSPKLLAASCTSAEQLKLLNTFCWLDEYATATSVTG